MEAARNKVRLQEHHRWLFLGTMVLLLVVAYLYSSRRLDKLQTTSLQLLSGAENQQFYADAQTIRNALDGVKSIDVAPITSPGADLNAFALSVGPQNGPFLGFVQDGQILDQEGANAIKNSRNALDRLAAWGVDTRHPEMWSDYEKLSRRIKALVPLYEMPLYIFIKANVRKRIVNEMVQKEIGKVPTDKKDWENRHRIADVTLSLTDVLDHRASIKGKWYFGATGSSTYALLSRVILPAHGITSASFPAGTVDTTSDYAEAQKNLDPKSKDSYEVAFFLLPQRSPFLKDVNIQTNYNLVPITNAPPLCYQHPELHPQAVIHGSFQGSEPFPKNDIPTVAVRMILACSTELPDPIAYNIVSEMYGSPECRAAFPSMKFADSRIGEIPSIGGDTGVTIYPFHTAAKLYLTDEPLSDVLPITVWTAAIPLVISAFGWMTLKLRKLRMRASAHDVLSEYEYAKSAGPPEAANGGYGTSKDFSLVGEDHLRDALNKVISDQILKEHYDVVKEMVRRIEARGRASNQAAAPHGGDVPKDQCPPSETA